MPTYASLSLACLIALLLSACASTPQPVASTQPSDPAAAETTGEAQAAPTDAGLGFNPFPSVTADGGPAGQ